MVPGVKGLCQIPCNSDHTPVIFVHGFLGSGDNWATQVMRFESNGYCSDRLFVFDWNSTGTRVKNDSLLNDLIDTVIRRTGAGKVNLVGHSAGGGLCYNYLKEGRNSRKVRRYIHIASAGIKKQAGPAGEIPTLVISSPDDKVIPRAGNADSAFRILIRGKDHLEVATCPEAFTAMYEFFEEGKKPVTASISPQISSPVLSGKVLMLGENTPLQGQEVLVYSFDERTGKRKEKKPIAKLITDNEGRWPPFVAPAGSWLEFLIEPANGRAVTYYLEPQVRNNFLVYLRTIPSSGLAAGMMKNIPAKDNQSAIAVFSSGKAIISGRDSLAVNDIPLSTETLMPASGTTISVFLFDDGDGKSSLKPVKSMGPGIFLNAIDMMIPASDKKSVGVYLNGRKISVPCKASDKTVMVIIFQ